MGLPSFYRWLVDKYPKVVMSAKEESGDHVDTTLPNPNGIEFHHLYLDMNGILHSCFHPDDDESPPPSTYDEVFKSIFECIDRIFRIVRPRKLLYMAIDGVAPRAKMNQQRARRFRTAKDVEFAAAEKAKLRRQFQAGGYDLLPEPQECEISDSNVITPGTLFMDKLSTALEYYIRLRQNTDPAWRKLKVILSDASVPGEGEHKIMSFIRLQRNLPGYDPNTVHCLYGLDADLIMLALATHETHFAILREDLQNQTPDTDVQAALKTSFSRAQYEEYLKTRESFAIASRMNHRSPSKPYLLLKIWTVRKYLEIDLAIPEPPFQVDLERQIDDFIFMLFFMGNDFLPRIPSLEIHEGAVDLLITVYKTEFKKIGGYLIDTTKMKENKAAYMKVKHVERFLLAIGSFEQKIFEKRQKIYQRWLERNMQDSLDSIGDDSEKSDNSLGQLSDTSGCVAFIDGDRTNIMENTKALNRALRNVLKDKSNIFKQGSLNDTVKLGAPGWRERYYKEKFSAVSLGETERLKKELVIKYTEGLCWVLQYYFAGVCSWNWFYPFYYAPFASDIKGMNGASVRFKLGAPLKPFQQLMAVLPPRSAHALPKAFQQLMVDPQSELRKFYPTEFDVDIIGKRFLWQGTVKLPFIQEQILLAETQKLEAELNEEEQKRNSSRREKIFLLRSHDLGEDICSLYETEKQGASIEIDSERSGGLNGFLLSTDEAERCHCISPVNGMKDIAVDHVVSAFYQNPEFHDHLPKLLENATIPSEEIKISDVVERNLWHEHEFSRIIPPQPCRSTKQADQTPHPRNEQHFQRRNGTSSNAGNNWRRDSPASGQSGRVAWKASGLGREGHEQRRICSSWRRDPPCLPKDGQGGERGGGQQLAAERPPRLPKDGQGGERGGGQQLGRRTWFFRQRRRSGVGRKRGP